MYVRVQYITNAATAQLLLATIQARMQPALMHTFMQQAVVPYIQQRTANRFAQQGDDVTGKWHPLAAATQQIRQSQGYQPTHPINVRTGQMRSFLTSSFGKVTSAGGMTQLEYPNSGNAAGALMRKLVVAQMGSANPATPARPVLGFGMNDSVAITAMVAGYLTI